MASHPNDPMGYLMRGITNEWYQLVKNKPGLNNSILDDYTKAKDLAETALASNPNNLDLQVTLGNAYMYMAKKYLDAGKKLKAGNTLKKAKKIMLEVIEQDPNKSEAYFAIGMFNYFADNVPPGFKWLAALLGFSGDRAKGIEYIKKAASASHLTQGDAQFMLYYIYSRKEVNYPIAQTYAEQLHKTYLNNPIFTFNLAEMKLRNKDYEESRALFGHFMQFCAQSEKQCSPKYNFLSNFFMAWSYMLQHKNDEAKPYVIKARELDTKSYKDRTEQIEKWCQKLKI